MTPDEKRILEAFNSRPHKEVDAAKKGEQAMSYLSTHDLTRRSTPWSLYIFHRSPSFNSRPHKEVDCLSRYFQAFYFLSTHDLTRRSTCPVNAVRSRILLSTHDLTRRSTINDVSEAGMKVFQLTTSQGGRHVDYICRNRCQAFNSRPHKEVDFAFFPEFPPAFDFQLTTSQGGRPFSIQKKAK